MNRFVRSPSFQRWIQSERDLTVELQNIRTFAAAQPGVAAEKGKGFPDFLHEVLNFRLKAIRALGGAFVKNSLIDYHSELISNYEKMSFIKLEMLRRFKEKLMTRKPVDEERSALTALYGKAMSRYQQHPDEARKLAAAGDAPTLGSGKPAELAAVPDAATLFDEASQATMVAKLAPVAATLAERISQRVPTTSCS